MPDSAFNFRALFFGSVVVVRQLNGHERRITTGLSRLTSWAVVSFCYRRAREALDTFLNLFLTSSTIMDTRIRSIDVSGQCICCRKRVNSMPSLIAAEKTANPLAEDLVTTPRVV